MIRSGAARAVLATFAVAAIISTAGSAFAGTLSLNGTGGATVTSSPPGIDCSAAPCSADFPVGTKVTLTATPQFAGQQLVWSGCETLALSSVCTVTVYNNSTGIGLSALPAPTDSGAFGLVAVTPSAALDGQAPLSISVTINDPANLCASGCSISSLNGAQFRPEANIGQGVNLVDIPGLCSVGLFPLTAQYPLQLVAHGSQNHYSNVQSFSCQGTTTVVDLSMVSGNQQTGVAGLPLAAPFVVKAFDASGQSVPNFPINLGLYQIPTQPITGNILPLANLVTGADGTASYTFTPGYGPGVYQIYVSTFAGSPTSFLFTATINAQGTTLSIVSGDKQVGTPGKVLAAPVVVKTLDSNGQPVANTSISFTVSQRPPGSTGDSLSPASPVTTANGTASSTFTAGTIPGVYKISASCSICTPNAVTFSVTVCASSFQTGNTVLVDPVPDLLSGPAVTMDASLLGSLVKGRIVQGVSADGVAQILVRIPACFAGESVTVSVLNDSNVLSNRSDEDGGLAAPGPATLNAFLSQVTVPTMTANGQPDGQPMAFVVYRAPIDFTRSNNTSDGAASARFVSLQINIPSLPTQPSPMQITVARPPVILVHGLWSSRSAWQFFQPISEDTSDAAFASRVFAVDYSSTATQSVLLNAYAVRSQIDGFLDAFRTSFDVAAIQADLVTHSMGGLIARTLPTLGLLYARRATYGRGTIHKLITIDTPHLGSELANQLDSSPSRCKSKFASAGNGIAGAIKDLRTDSSLVTQRLVSTGANHLLVHTIAGEADPVQTSLTENTWSLLGLRTVYCANLLPDGTFAGTFGGDSDLIVSATSQQALALGSSGLISSTVIGGFVHAVQPTLFAYGPDVLSTDIQNSQVIGITTGLPTLVRNLLNSGVQSSFFTPMLPGWN